jgi:uroporphyrinogen III methyltransferase/synthase
MVKNFKIPDLNTYDVFVFTSRNGVKLFCAKYPLPLDKQYFAIGSTTQKELEQEGVSAACPEKYTSTALGELLQQHLAPGSKILLVRSVNASSDLRKMLEKRFFVKEIAAYEVVPQSVKKEELEGIDAIFITAGSVARALEPNLSHLKQTGTILVSIGPMTSKIIAEIGIEPDLEARTHTIEGMVRELIEYFNKKK